MATSTIRIAALLALSLPTLSMPATAVAAPAQRQTGLMTMNALETRATQLGLHVTELKVKGLIAEIEGMDRNGRKVELMLHRRTGEVLDRHFDD